MATTDFVDLWAIGDNSFETDPPNAVLSCLEHGADVSDDAELGSPFGVGRRHVDSAKWSQRVRGRADRAPGSRSLLQGEGQSRRWIARRPTQA